MNVMATKELQRGCVSCQLSFKFRRIGRTVSVMNHGEIFEQGGGEEIGDRQTHLLVNSIAPMANETNLRCL